MKETGSTVRVSDLPKVWDCQLGEFILNYQTTPYPSLNQAAEKYGLTTKLDIVKTEYWEKGIDTDQIPEKILREYNEYDVELTYQVYLKQKEQFETTHKHLFPLFRLCCADLLVLLEMEQNGMLFNQDKADELSKEADIKLVELRSNILGAYSSLPINLDSGDHLSSFLYGGTVTHSYRVPAGVYGPKAQKAGEIRYKWLEEKFDFPRIFEPLPKSELKKEGYFSTDEPTLRQLKTTKSNRYIIDNLLEYGKLDKLNGTYYKGLSSLIKEMDWKPNTIHTQFNQVVARTGRLSSSNPNLQNISSDCKELFYTRYT